MSENMATDELRQRHGPTNAQVSDSKSSSEASPSGPTRHPGGDMKHGPWQQALRMFLFAVYFNGSILA